MQDDQLNTIKLSRRIQNLLVAARKAGLTYLTSEIDSLNKKLADEDFYVVIVGQFKRGKSSLINALLGAPLAPVAVTPLTSAITIFAHATRNYGEVYFADGTKTEVAIADIASYISEDLNAENYKQVVSVTAYCDAPVLNHLNLIDTPGLGSVYEHNNETTLRFIPKIDVALLVLSADTPISKADLDFLRKIKDSVQRFIFVLNKCDLLDEHQLNKLISYNQGIIATELNTYPEEIQLLSVSAKSVERSTGVSALHNRLLQMAQSEKTAILQASTKRQFGDLKQQVNNMLKLELDALLTPVNTLEEQLATFRASQELLVKGTSEFNQLLQFKVKEIDGMVHEAIIRESKELKTLITTHLHQHYPAGQPSRAQKETLKGDLDNLVFDHYSLAKKTMEVKIKQLFGKVLDDFNQRSRSFLNELVKQLSFLMHIDLDKLTDKFDLNVYTSFYLTLNMEHSPVNDQSWYFFLLSQSDQRSRSIQSWIKHYDELLIINNAAVIYDLQYKAQEALRQFIYDLNGHFSGVVEQIERTIAQALDQKQASSEAAEQSINRIKGLLQEVADL